MRSEEEKERERECEIRKLLVMSSLYPSRVCMLH